MPLDYLQAKKSWAFQYRRMSHISISLTFNLQFPPYLLDSQYIRTANSVPSLACHIKSLLIKVLTIRQRGQITGGYLCSIFYWLGGPHCQQKVSDAPPNPILTPVFSKHSQYQVSQVSLGCLQSKFLYGVQEAGCLLKSAFGINTCGTEIDVFNFY